MDGIEQLVEPGTASPGQGVAPSTGFPYPRHDIEDALAVAVGSSLDDASEALAELRASVAADARLFGFAEAADFAGRVEDLSRQLEYVQVVAAQAVERTRREAAQVESRAGGSARQAGSGGSAVAPQWRTGWTEPVTPSADSDSAAATQAPARASSAVGSVLDDGYRNAAEFLRARLRIGIGEARRRLALTPNVLPQTGITGQDIPARREHLAGALADGTISSRSATIISTALDKVHHLAPAELLARMEHALTTTATETDPDFVTKMANRWTDRIDQDGPEPPEETLRQLQGAFLRRRRRHGLHHLEIFATTEQYETLTTAMNIATNPRLTTTSTGTTSGDAQASTDTQASADTSVGTTTSTDTTAANGLAAAASNTKATAHIEAGPGQESGSPGPELDRRTRAQKLLDGLVGACAVAMTTGKLPSNGGLRPQLTVNIDYRDLCDTIRHHPTSTGTSTSTTGQGTGTGTTGQGTSTGTGTGTGTTGQGTSTTAGPRISTGTATFTGPIHPNTIRKIACDADIIPVVLGSDSEILNIGRTSRIFPPHIRKAITARDGGCAFPDCTIPAPWCEAHHITYWSHQGTTGTNNGTLLCSHHHHLIHKEQWRITMETGTPWFIPPPHIDPHQTPRRNHHHTPPKT
ncbi:HNH endonuclease signature motif containing protein [Paenarthrobacter nitroguajacolicus]|uniref:HNH endonuclease signature motif containing protein n=1 Tax=Paenarthrobacter nitroguajacolicus TaxID=211146 RepID=UPI00248C1E4C|nr:HNH endonuclease signature motif containing protein [Paenarthrobacter nitroguajacolicus]MDI2034892.1 hypothetical protein [Paenarthrobacter nitroguajacolicus]